MKLSLPMLVLVACSKEAEPTGPEQLDPVAILARASLDARGIRPSEEEIVAVEEDPAALEGLLDEFIASDAFPERLVALYNEVLRTRADRIMVSLDNVAFQDDAFNLAFRHSVGEEPLRFFWYVAQHDLPYTDVVTADYTVANDDMLAFLPMDAIEEGTGWRAARYRDDRPGVGILSSTGFYWRYTSTTANANRGRAAAVARSLLCDNRYESAVSFQGATDGLAERTQTDPACISCHASLDPLAAHFWGFMWRNQEAWTEVTQYDSSREGHWQQVTGVPPGYYGAPSDGLRTLGETMAADPRFVNCAVETGMKFWLREGVSLDDAESFKQHREAFLGGDLRLRALYRSFLDDPSYRSVDRGDEATRPRTLAPDQLATSIEALTGFRWTYGGNDMLDIDETGVRLLAGGVDGFIASEPSPDPSTTTLLVQERLAEAAGDYAVTRESALEADARTLLREIDLVDATPSDADLTAQMQALFLRIHSRRLSATDEDVVSLVAFWKQQAAAGTPSSAWADVLTALFRHPDFDQY